MTFPQVRVSGNAHERGRQYGEQCAPRVRRSVEAYAVVFEHYAGWDWERVRVEAARYAEHIEAFGPSYAEEIRGIADGAGLTFEDVLAINVRTEVMYAAKARNAAMLLPRTLECTAFAAVPDDDRAVLVGQNWDWKTHAFDTAVVKPILTWMAINALPKTCDSGNQRYCRSSGLMMSYASMAAPSYVHADWASRTPLGRPVVPEV